VDDEQNPNDEELRDALEAAAVLDDDALARVEVATQVADAAEAAEEQAVADGDFAAAERIDQEAGEVITGLIEEAVVEAETAEDVVESVLDPPADEAAAPDDVASLDEGAMPDEELVVVPEAAPKAPPEPADAGSGDPFRGPGDWYVVHTYAGYENKVKANLESRIHTMQMEDKIFRVHIPMEDVMEIKSGKKQVVQKKVFPGYLLVKMLYDNDSWYVVRNTPGVTGFVSAGTGSKPTPLSKREVEKILVVKKEEQKPQVRLGFEEGDVVRIISGPFADFNGTISEINPDQAKLKVLVNIFDRETPVELSFDQVAKV
jgi:transcription termination/antitermination protein NusG